MTDRRGARPSQVRPRPPSTGRPIPPKARPRTPAPYRPLQHRRVDRGSGLPLVAKGLLALCVVALGAVILYGATGQIGKIVASVGSSLSGFLANLSTSPSPAAESLGPVANPPSLDAPTTAYTNESSVDLSGTVPLTVIGLPGYTITLYQTLQGVQPTPIRDHLPIPVTATFTIPGVKLVSGSNIFTATIVGPGGESSPSSPITYVLDTSKPKVTILSPKNGSRVNGSSINVTGRTQANSTILAANTTTHLSSTAAADNNGSFTVSVSISAGRNAISVTATDPASNTSTTSFSVVRGTGKLTLTLASSAYQFSSRRGGALTFSATLLDPDGKAIANQSVTFTIGLAGLAANIQIRSTDSKGHASVAVHIGPHAADSGVGKQGTVTASADPSSGHVQRTITVTTTK
jgi:Glucodextranase, domain B